MGSETAGQKAASTGCCQTCRFPYLLYPDIARDPFSILIAVTSEDMYTSYFDWRYVENWRTEGRFAVVSSAAAPAFDDGEMESRMVSLAFKKCSPRISRSSILIFP